MLVFFKKLVIVRLDFVVQWLAYALHTACPRHKVFNKDRKNTKRMNSPIVGFGVPGRGLGSSSCLRHRQLCVL